MPSVLFDYTRVISALGQTPERPQLVLSNLAKVIEGLVLYDMIYTTEQIPHQFMTERLIGSPKQPGYFDFEKDYIYQPIFAEVFRTIPPEVHDTLGGLYLQPRIEYHGRSILEADLAILDKAMSMVSRDSFQNLWETEPTELEVAYTLERIRTLTTLAGELGVPYDPLSCRIPLLDLSIPGNLSRSHLEPYRLFESDVRIYLKQLLGDRLGFEFPLMLAIVLRECRPGSPDDIFANALQLRSDPIFVRFREFLDEYLVAYQALDMATLAKTDRVLKNETNRLKSRLSSELQSELKLTLKPGWFPISGGWEFKTILQRFRDRKQRIPIANLACLTEETLRSLGAFKDKIEAILPLEL